MVINEVNESAYNRHENSQLSHSVRRSMYESVSEDNNDNNLANRNIPTPKVYFVPDSIQQIESSGEEIVVVREKIQESMQNIDEMREQIMSEFSVEYLDKFRSCGVFSEEDDHLDYL